MEDLVVGLAAGAVLLEAGNDSGVLLAAGAASERRVELGVGSRGIGAGALLLLDTEGRGADGGESLARRLAADGGREASRDGHGGGRASMGAVSTMAAGCKEVVDGLLFLAVRARPWRQLPQPGHGDADWLVPPPNDQL